MKNSLRPFRRSADRNDAAFSTRFASCRTSSIRTRSAKSDIFYLADRPGARNMAYASRPEASRSTRRLRRRVMADESDEQSSRAFVLTLAGLAVAGWLAAGFVWWQGG